MCDSKKIGKVFKLNFSKDADKREIRLSLLSEIVGISEHKMSNYINGIDPMPKEVAEKIKKVIGILQRIAMLKNSDKLDLTLICRMCFDLVKF